MVELLEDSAPDGASAAPADTPDEAPAGELHAMRELVATLQAQNSIFQEQLQAKDRQIGELHILLQQTQAALPPPRQRRWWWPFP